MSRRLSCERASKQRSYYEAVRPGRRITARLTNWGRAKVLQKQDTLLDGALTVAHASWHFAACAQVGRRKKRALTGRYAI
jgi:hypothetical protein